MAMPSNHPRATEARELAYEDAGMDGLRIFGGSSNPGLTERIARDVGVPAGHARIERFPDGEMIVKLDDDVRGRDCFVVQSTCPPVNENLVELLIFIDCLVRASARRITAVIPYFGYARQDRKAEGRTPITAKLVANLLTEAGANRVLTMDLHAEQIQGFFDIPVDHLTALPVICEHFLSKSLGPTVVVSPDVGNIKMANAYNDRLGAELVVIEKRRLTGDKAVASRIIGDVKGKSVLMFDDMITTGGTMCEAVKLLRAHGARQFHLAATHAVLAGAAVERLAGLAVDEIVVTDTIPVPADKEQRLGKLVVRSVAGLMGQAIKRIHLNQSVSALFSNSHGRS